MSDDLSDDNISAASESKNRAVEKPLLLIISGLVLASAVGLASYSLLRGREGNGEGNTGGTVAVSPDKKTVVQQEVDALCDSNQTPISIRDLNQSSASALSKFDGNTNNQPMVTDQTAMSAPTSLTEDKQHPSQNASKSNLSNNLLTATSINERAFLKDCQPTKIKNRQPDQPFQRSTWRSHCLEFSREA